MNYWLVKSEPFTFSWEKFVKENWERHPEIFRKTWATFKNHEKMKDQKTLEGF